MSDRTATSRPPAESATADATILVIEDDEALGLVLRAALTPRARQVEIVTSGAAGLELASRLEPDVVVLDLGLPDIDGVDLCRQLRRWFRNPIVVLSADGAEQRKIDALDEGADDYVTKPFSMDELLARLRVALRHRRLVAAVADDRVLEVGALRVDTAADEAGVAGRRLELTAKEFSLLAVLARTPGRVLTHGTLIAEVWGSDAPPRIDSLRVHVTGLRRKLGAGPGHPEIRSEPGVGYRLALD